MKLTVTTPATGRPVSAADLAGQLRLDNPDGELDYLNLLIDAATQYAEDAMSCSLITQTITAIFNLNELPILTQGPVQTVSSVTDAHAAITNYTLETYGNNVLVVCPHGFTAPLTVVYVAGFGASTAIPAKFKLPILTHAATLYEHRTSIDDKEQFVVPHSLDAFYQLNSRAIPVA